LGLLNFCFGKNLAPPKILLGVNEAAASCVGCVGGALFLPACFLAPFFCDDFFLPNRVAVQSAAYPSAHLKRWD
jgi:hypothetical protein